MKPKSSKAKGGGYDNCGTPTYALKPILPYIKRKIIWESASNEDRLIATAIRHWPDYYGLIETGLFKTENDPRHLDFFSVEEFKGIDVQITNPPFSLKFDWIEHSYDIGIPFALILPVETLGAGKAMRLFDALGIEVILMTRRVNFKMPVKGWDCQAQFPVAWFTWGLNIGKQISVCEIDNKLDPLTLLTEL